MGLEIERKFTIKNVPETLSQYPVKLIEQGYLSVIPAIRVRREDDRYYMTYKCRKGFGYENNEIQSGGEIGKVEYNLPLDIDSYNHLVEKADGYVIRKKRYIIPLNDNAFSDEYIAEHEGMRDLISEGKIKIELDVFEKPFEGFIMAEVEFPDEESASAYRKADWFDTDVTGDSRFSNAYMSAYGLEV